MAHNRLLSAGQHHHLPARPRARLPPRRGAARMAAATPLRPSSATATAATHTATTIPTISTPTDALDALANVDTLLVDQDGVLWRGNEDVPGAAAALASLQLSGRRLVFVTNNSTLSRRGYASKLSKRLGFEVKADQVVCSAWSAAEYLRSRGFGGGEPASSGGNGNGSAKRAKKVLALGEVGLFEELDLAGIPALRGPVLEIPAASTPTAPLPPHLPLASLDCSSGDIAAWELDPSISAVVVGWSARQFSYSWIAYAAACLREIPGCELVVTNRDAADALPSGRLLPGTGAILAAVEAAAWGGSSHTKSRAVDAGKGGEWLLRDLLPRAVPRFDPSTAAMIGDRLDTDVAFAVQGGFRAAFLTLTGVATREQAESAAPERKPTHILPSIANLTL